YPHAWYGKPSDAETASGPLAGRLVPGVRLAGRMNPEYERTQTWIVDVPEGVTSLHVRLYNATGDFDLSAAPGWQPSPVGIDHRWSAYSLRHNEQLSVTADEGETLTPGLYTVAVWSSVIDTPARYEIEVAFDEPLSAGASYTPISE